MIKWYHYVLIILGYFLAFGIGYGVEWATSPLGTPMCLRLGGENFPRGIDYIFAVLLNLEYWQGWTLIGIIVMVPVFSVLVSIAVGVFRIAKQLEQKEVK
jgi:hypothetical protein